MILLHRGVFVDLRNRNHPDSHLELSSDSEVILNVNISPPD